MFSSSVDETEAQLSRTTAHRTSYLAESDIRALALADPTLTERDIGQRLASGQRCRLWWIGDEIAHYHWFTLESARLPFLQLTYRSRPGDYLVLGAFTHPRFRNRGLHTESVAWCARAAAELGQRRRVTFVAWWNAPSLAAVRKRYEKIGTVTRLNLGFTAVYRSTGHVRLDGDTLSLDDRGA